ncbi:MerR family transcriptional regulator [Chloroflexota bacterium]
MVDTIEKTTYSIGEFASKVHLSPFTLRYYEKEGLLPPPHRLHNNHRVYTDYDIPWIRLLGCLRYIGMSISEVHHFVELCKQGNLAVQERKQIILQQKQKIEKQLEEIKIALIVINKEIKDYDEIETIAKTVHM